MSAVAPKTRPGPFGKKGLFVNGIWHCDCHPTRLPAEKFEVKNGSKNHGRLFYTCQNPQPKRCSFFLWADDAKVREEAAVLNNSRSEPGTALDQNIGPGRRLRTDQGSPKAPPRQTKITDPFPARKPIEGGPSSKSLDLDHAAFEDDLDDLVDWSSSGDEDFLRNTPRPDGAVSNTTGVEPARKAARTSLGDSPGRRANFDRPESNLRATVRLHEDPKTPTRDAAHPPTGMLSPSETPFNTRRQLFPAKSILENAQSSVLAEPKSDAQPKIEFMTLQAEAMSILQPVRTRVPPETMNKLIALLKRHEMKTSGIEKGRDMARSSLEAREKRIAELEQQVSHLLLQQESNRSIIKHLKEDITNQLITSPKRSRRNSRYASNG